MRPGFTCTAEITTATRKQVVSVPIQALTVRELLYDAAGQRRARAAAAASHGFRFGAPRGARAAAAPAELKPGQKREETEGVFVMSDGKADLRAGQDSASPVSAISK